MQKSIVRNGLIATLFAIMLLMFCMPAKAEAKSYDMGNMNGFYFIFPATEGEYSLDANTGVEYYINDALQQGTLTIENGGVNLESIYNEYFANADEGANLTVKLKPTYVKTADGTNPKKRYYGVMFESIKAQTLVDSPTTQDVEFKYGLDSYMEEMVDTDNLVAWVDKEDDVLQHSYLCNSLVIKKGAKESTGTLALALLNAYNGSLATRLKIWNFKELSNNGGYATDPTMYGFVRNGDVTGIISYENYDNDPDKYIAAFDAAIDGKTTGPELKAALDSVHSKLVEVEVAKFEHKGVQTADSSDIALWIAIFAIAAVAAGAVALKRD